MTNYFYLIYDLLLLLYFHFYYFYTCNLFYFIYFQIILFLFRSVIKGQCKQNRFSRENFCELYARYCRFVCKDFKTVGSMIINNTTNRSTILPTIASRCSSRRKTFAFWDDGKTKVPKSMITVREYERYDDICEDVFTCMKSF